MLRSESEDIPQSRTANMKLLLLFFLVGYATAYDSALEEVAENVFTNFMLEEAEEAAFSMYAEDDVTTEAGKKLREMLDDLMEKIRDRVEKGKQVKEKIMDKVKEIREKMKEMKIDMGEKAKELLQKVRDRVRNLLDEFMKKIGGDDTQERSVEDDEFDLINQLATSRLRDMMNKLKEYLRQQIDKEKLKEKVEEIFGKGNDLADSILDIIKTKGGEYKDKLHELVDKYLGKKDKRSLKEYWEKIKNYFKDLHIDLKERYAKFGEWVKDRLSNSINVSKDKMENIKQIAKEFIDHTKGVSKDVAAEALEFMKPYKEDLGNLWNQLKDTVKDILQKKE